MNIRGILLFTRERYILLTIIICLLCISVSYAWIVFAIRPGAGLLPLHYSILFGVDRLGTRSQLYLVPTTSLTIMVLNTSFAYYIFHRDKYASYYLMLMAALFSAISFFSLFLLTGYAY
jgi:hypothetical protein